MTSTFYNMIFCPSNDDNLNNKKKCVFFTAFFFIQYLLVCLLFEISLKWKETITNMLNM